MGRNTTAITCTNGMMPPISPMRSLGTPSSAANSANGEVTVQSSAAAVMMLKA